MAGVVDEKSRLEVVAAVRDNVIAANEGGRVGRGQALRVRDEIDFGVHAAYGFARAFHFRPADAIRRVDHLPLQVRKVDLVVVHYPDRADSRGGEVEQQRRPQAAGADDQNARLQ